MDDFAIPECQRSIVPLAVIVVFDRQRSCDDMKPRIRNRDCFQLLDSAVGVIDNFELVGCVDAVKHLRQQQEIETADPGEINLANVIR